MGVGSGVTHLLDPDALVCALARVGAGVRGLESVSVYLLKKRKITTSVRDLMQTNNFSIEKIRQKIRLLIRAPARQVHSVRGPHWMRGLLSRFPISKNGF